MADNSWFKFFLDLVFAPLFIIVVMMSARGCSMKHIDRFYNIYGGDTYHVLLSEVTGHGGGYRNIVFEDGEGNIYQYEICELYDGQFKSVYTGCYIHVYSDPNNITITSSW